MASFLTAAQKASMQAVMTNIHDTFKRSLKAFKDGKKVILSTNPSYSHIYKQPVANVEREKVERTIEARIYYLPRHQDKENASLSTEDSLKLQQEAAQVRIKVTVADYEFLKTAERVVLDDHPYEIISTEVPHGLFGSGFYTFYLRRAA